MKYRQHLLGALVVTSLLFAVDAFWLYAHRTLTSQAFVQVSSEVGNGQLQAVAQGTNRPLDFVLAVLMLSMGMAFCEGPVGNTEPHGLASFVWQLSYPMGLMLGGLAGASLCLIFGWYAGLIMFAYGALFGAVISALFGLTIGIMLRPWRTP